MRTALILLALFVGLVGCQKKSSKEFFEAQGNYDSLVDSRGDEAYFTDEMDDVVVLLTAVAEGAREYSQAQVLLSHIGKERTRIEEERKAQAREEAANQQAPGPVFPRAAERPPDAEKKEEPAAEEGPTGGMKEETFKEKYRGCVGAAQKMTLEGVGEVPAYEASSRPDCLKRLALSAPAKFFFVKGALAGRVVRTTTVTRTILDGGAPSTIALPPQRSIAFPGAPAPGYVPPSPTPGALAPAATGDGLAPNTAGTTELAPRPNP